MNHYETNLDKNDANFVPLTPLSFLERAKDIYPNYEALVYENRSYTWTEVYKRCTKFASALEKIEIIPKDTKSNPIDALKVSKELYNDGVKIIIGPVFNESTKYLDDLKNVTFISFTNKLIDNPKNVISAGVNAISQLQTIKKFNEKNSLSESVFLIPRSQFKKEIEKTREEKIAERLAYMQAQKSVN